MKVNAYAALSRAANLEPFTYDRPTLAADEVRIKVSHCGICHSDIHLVDNDWRSSKYPLVPGHELVGELIEKGDDVTHLNIGDRVGFGWQSGACLECEWCSTGFEPLCAGSEATCMTQYGGFGEEFVGKGHFGFRIPDGLASEVAAPLLCGGITVYSPMKLYGLNHTHKVGVLGVGGLGHMAIQFAAAMGCEVVAISTSAHKKEEAMALGATDFLHSREPEEFERLKGGLDFILHTATAQLDYISYMKLMRPRGKFIILSGGGGDLNIPSGMVLNGMKTIAGSMIGGRQMMREMLEFAARKNIGAQIEIFPISRVNEAMDHIRENNIRYRAVLEIPGS